MRMALHARARWPASVMIGLALAAVVLVSSVTWDLAHLPTDPALGLDFGSFYSAGSAWSHGLDPYNWAQLRSTETHLPSIGDPRRPMSFNSYANPPLFAWSMTIFGGMAPRSAYAVWLALMLAALLGGIALTARTYGVNGPGWLALLFAVSPAPAIALFLGQQTPLLLLGLAAAVAAIRRGRMDLAGIALCLGWIKPHLLFPVALVIVATLSWRDARRLAIWFLSGSAVLGAVSWLLTGGPLFAAWLRVLVLYGRTMDSWQPDLSSLAGLYLTFLPRAWSGIVGLALMGGWLLLAACLVCSMRRRRLAATDDAWLGAVGCALAAWLLAVPYTHPADLVLLAITLPVVFGRRFERLHDPSVRLALAMLVVAPEADLMGFRPNFVLSYSVLVPLALLLALRPWRQVAPKDLRADATALTYPIVA